MPDTAPALAPPDADRWQPAAWDADSAGRVRLWATRCRTCALLTFPPADTCPGCWAQSGLDREQLPGSGQVHAFSVVRVSEPGIPAPYGVGLVDLGPVRVTARLLDPESLAVGSTVEPVAGVLRDRERPLWGPVFRRAQP